MEWWSEISSLPDGVENHPVAHGGEGAEQQQGQTQHQAMGLKCTELRSEEITRLVLSHSSCSTWLYSLMEEGDKIGNFG